MDYLRDQMDTVVEAVNEFADAFVGTTVWTRSMKDAKSLESMLQAELGDRAYLEVVQNEHRFGVAVSVPRG